MREHGTRTMYVHGGCRVDADCPNTSHTCAQANREYSVANHRARHQGRVRLVDARGVRAHLKRLSELGIGYKRVAQLAGVSKTSLAKVLSGQTRRVRPETAVAVLSVKATHADKALVDGRLAWQRIEEFLAAGYTRTWLAAQLGSQAARPALQLRHERITAGHAKAIAALYRAHLAPDGRLWPARPRGRERVAS